MRCGGRVLGGRWEGGERVVPQSARCLGRGESFARCSHRERAERMKMSEIPRIIGPTRSRSLGGDIKRFQ